MFADLDRSTAPGAVVGVAVEGRALYRKGFGRANLELPSLLTPSSRLRIASTTKHFVAFAYLLLCEQEKARLDDPIARHVESLGPSLQGITVEQLLTHTSGVRDSDELSALLGPRGKRISFAQQVEIYRALESREFAAGERWSYNNGGYTLVTAAIESITGKELGEVLHELIFAPLGMWDTALRRRDDDFVEGAATLHMIDGEGRFNRDYLDLELAGAGGLISTIDDLLCWLRHMRAPSVGSSDTWRIMKTPRLLTSGANTRYSLGLMHRSYRGVQMIHHPGAVLGGTCQMLTCVDPKLDIVVITNRQDRSAPSYAQALLDLFMGAAPAVSIPHALLDERAFFQSKRTGRFVELRNDPLTALIDGIACPMVATDLTTLRHVPTRDYLGHTLTLVGDAQHPKEVELNDFGELDELERIEPARDTPPLWQARYRSAELGAEAIIDVRNDGATLKMVSALGAREFCLTQLSANVWTIADAPGAATRGLVDFSADGSGFHFSSLRLRGLRFTRHDEALVQSEGRTS